MRGIVLSCAMLVPVALWPQEPDALQGWLANNAVPLRSIDAGDEDFSDLEPLVQAIGPAQLVQLGEPTHAAGGSFAAKVRLIKFLHQRMGFDVVVWESGMYDVRLTERALRAGEDPVQAGRRGIFPIWSMSEQVRPLLEYAQRSHGSGEPLEMAGFDMQFSGAGTYRQLAADLRAFLQVLAPGELRTGALAVADEALARYEALPLEAPIALEDLARFRRAAESLVDLLERERKALQQAHGTAEFSFMQRAVENLLEFGVKRYEHGFMRGEPGEPDRTTLAVRNRGWNRRDSQNARNLRWMLEDYYAGRKVVLWAHNGHIMNACYAADWGSLSPYPQPDGAVPSGVFVTRWLGERVYTIGFTAYGGEDGWVTTGQRDPVQPAAAGSLEYRLHALGKSYLFVDFRQVDAQPEHPLHRPQSMRIRGYTAEEMPDLTQVFDGILYVDRMTPATRVTGK